MSSNQPYYAAHGGGGMSNPVIVQGTVVQGTPVSTYDHHSTQRPLPQQQQQHQSYVSTYDHHSTQQPLQQQQQQQQTYVVNLDRGDGEWTKGEVQPKRCNDVFFALLFYAHLGLMAWAAAANVPQMANTMVKGYEGYDRNGGGGGGGGRNRYLRGADTLGEELMMDGGEEDAASSPYVNMFTRALSIAGRTAAHGITSTASRRYLEEEQNDAAAEDGDDYNMNVDVNGIMFILGISFVVAFIISGFALSFMIHFAEGLVKLGLFFNIVVAGLLTLAGFLSGAVPLALMGLIMLGFSAYYAYVVWARIPFAASNLITAVTSVRANFGLTFLAYVSLLFLFGWSMWWSVAFVSSMFVLGGCDADGQCQNEVNGLVVFLFIVSYYWTHQVIKNTIHVTVAGTVGTWWFTPREASSCCSRGIRDSLIRAITFSFGSICFGSLIVAIIQATKEILRQLRESEDSMLLCCAECLLGCLEALVEYFNQWAFVFVGLYGYTFMEAGKNVMTLFKTRGWTTIITDNLVDTVLFMVSIGVGLITGVIAIIIAQMKGMDFEDGGGPIPFIIGLVLGFVLSTVLMSVVSSAVNTVIVCYAEAPNEFQANHPQLSNQMRAAWRQAWPVEFNY